MILPTVSLEAWKTMRGADGAQGSELNERHRQLVSWLSGEIDMAREDLVAYATGTLQKLEKVDVQYTM